MRRAVFLGLLVLQACTLFHSKDDYFTANAGPSADGGSDGGSDARIPSPLPDGCTFTEPVHELVNPITGGRLYTLHPEEAGAEFIESNGLAFRAASYPSGKHEPVYQLHRRESDDRLYTTNEAERDRVLREGYDDEGTAFYGAGQPGPCVVEIQSLQRGAIHRLTPSLEEVDAAGAEGWKHENARFYAGPR